MGEKKRYRRAMLYFIFCLFFIFTGKVFAEEKQYESFIDGYFKRMMAEHNVPGAAMVMVKDGEILLSKSYGYANITNQTPVDTEETVFRVASIAKLLTSMGVLKLADEGTISLNDPANQYLTTIQLSDTYQQEITIEHLLTHTEGLEQSSIGGKTLDSNAIKKQAIFLQENIPNQISEPGKMITYGNHTMAILGTLIEDVTGMSYEEYMEKAILAPLGMDHSSFSQPLSPELLKKRVTEYRFRNGEFIELEGSYSHMVSAGGMHTTAEDLGRLLTLLLSEDSKLLSYETIQSMLTRQFSSHASLPGISYALLEEKANGISYFYRDGDSEGAKARVIVVPEENLGFVILVNSDSDELRDEFFDEFANNFFPDNHNSINRLPIEKPEQLSGTYYYVQYPRNDFTKMMVLFTGIKVEVLNGTTINVSPLGEEPFGKFDKPKTFVQVEPFLFLSEEGEHYLAFGENEQSEIEFLFSGAGYHGSYVKVKWYENPGIHKLLYIVFIVLFFIGVIYWIVKLVKHKTLKRTDHLIGIISTLNLLFLSLFFPAVFLVGMTPGLPAFTKGVNYFMIVVFTLPIASGIFSIVLIRTQVKNHSGKYTITSFFFIFLVFYYAYLYYWRVLGYWY
ncbi:hypothetical protein BKP45_20610 [Anaerobacillus alkalidiazotrophicus]|uniref:Beta-lactamase-related domain-containing protein n=1 Tax=Anaerobacillus alkalidiazotrophicus TaxID=472963 RepID=A0A1S2LZU1_9BACI|nr:serine hydrolase domain-containing protein [Anaerobacillus alkalidiazotrophicus]OIJ17959.1 hypothetical protein BKP45_20610 [Anaerobacillus alkalidiazotrophicus]